MEFLAGLACSLLGIVAVLVVPVWSLVSATRVRKELAELRNEVDRLASEVAALRRGGGALPSRAPLPTPEARPVEARPVEAPPVEAPFPAIPVPPPAAKAPPPPPRVEPPPPRPPPPPPAPPVRIETLVVWFAASLGGLVLVVAVLFALREAVRAGYLGPAVRFAMAVGTGVGAWALGEPLRRRGYRVPAEALAGGGAAILYGALYAGHVRYGVLSNPVTFGWMVGLTAASGFVAVRRSSVLLAVLSAVGGFVTPVLLSTGENRAVAYFAYLGLVNAGVLYAASRRGWWWLVGLAGVVTAVLHAGWGLSFRAPDQVPVALIAAAALGGLHLLVAARSPDHPRLGAALPGGPMGTAAGLGGLLILLAGGAFVVPADPLRSDPRSLLPLPWSLGASATWALGYLGVVTAGLAFLARRSLAWAVAGGGPVAVLTAAYVLGWVTAGTPRWELAAAAAVGVPALHAALGRRGGVATGLLAVSGLLLVLAPVLEAPEARVQVATALGLGLVAVGVSEGLGARLALLIGLVGTVLPIYPVLSDRLVAGESSLVFAAVAFGWAAAALPALLRPRAGDLGGTLAAALAGPVAFWALWEVWEDQLGDDLPGALPLLLGVPTLLGAQALRRALGARAGERERAILLSVGLLAAAVAIPVQLQESWLTVGWAIEVAALAELSRRVRWGGVKVFLAALAAAVAVRLLLNPEALEYGGGEGMIVLNWTLYTWGIPMAALLVAAARLPGPGALVRALRVAAVLIGFALVNLEVAHAFAHDGRLSFSDETLAESMTRSIAWGAYGLAIIVVGVVRDSKIARLGGFAFAVLAAVKVCLFDVWNLSGFIRAGSFLGLAVILLLAALAFQRVVLRERSP